MISAFLSGWNSEHLRANRGCQPLRRGDRGGISVDTDPRAAQQARTHLRVREWHERMERTSWVASLTQRVELYHRIRGPARVKDNGPGLQLPKAAKGSREVTIAHGDDYDVGGSHAIPAANEIEGDASHAERVGDRTSSTPGAE
jgi:hypothetical protein